MNKLTCDCDTDNNWRGLGFASWWLGIPR